MKTKIILIVLLFFFSKSNFGQVIPHMQTIWVGDEYNTQTSVKLFENSKDIKYMTVYLYYYDEKWKYLNTGKIYFTKDEKLINNVADLPINYDENFDMEYDNTLYSTVIAFGENEEIVHKKTIYINKILKYPEIDKEYILNKIDSTTLTIDFFNTFFVKKPYIHIDSLTHSELKMQINKKKQLVYSTIGYLKRGYALETNSHIEYAGNFHIGYNFYEFNAFEEEKVESKMRELIAKKIPNISYDILGVYRTAVKYDKEGKEYFTWQFIVCSDKEFYDKIKAMEGIEILHGYDWQEYMYSIYTIDLY